MQQSLLCQVYSNSATIPTELRSSPKIPMASFSWSAYCVSSHWPWGQEHPVCLSSRAAVAYDKQMYSVSSVATCIWMSRFSYLTRDWDLWREHLRRQTGRKGHLLAVTNSSTIVTFIFVSFGFAYHHFTHQIKHPYGWSGVKQNGHTAKDLYRQIPLIELWTVTKMHCDIL